MAQWSKRATTSAEPERKKKFKTKENKRRNTCAMLKREAYSTRTTRQNMKDEAQTKEKNTRNDRETRAMKTKYHITYNITTITTTTTTTMTTIISIQNHLTLAIVAGKKIESENSIECFNQGANYYWKQEFGSFRYFRYLI